MLKLTDLTSVFELFIFSDLLELHREILKEGNSLILNLVKSISEEQNRFKRINIQKIGSLSELINKPIKEITFDIQSEEQLDEISKFLTKNGKTLINIIFRKESKNLKFQLENKRNLDRKPESFKK